MPAMENDPAREWQRLQEVYSQMSDDELQLVAIEAYALTDVAKQALAAEIKTRNLNVVLQEVRPVIYGAGHLGWLQQDAANDPSVKLRKLSEFVATR